MALELIFKVSGNATTETKKLQEQLKKLKVTTKGTTQGFSLLNASFLKIAGSAYVLKKAYDAVIGSGLEYNKNIEQQIASI